MATHPDAGRPLTAHEAGADAAVADAGGMRDAGATSTHSDAGHVNAFGSPEECANCHPNHAAEWATSQHAYAIADPVFQAMLRLAAAQTSGIGAVFCVRCHSPMGILLGESQLQVDPKTGKYGFDLAQLDPVSQRGVFCDVCHTMVKLRQVGGALFALGTDGTRYANIADPTPNAYHTSTVGQLQSNSDLCSACHEVQNELGQPKVVLEDTFGEWNGVGFFGRRSCQACHMPSYDGSAAPDAPQRTLHRHTFVGVDVSLLEPGTFPGDADARAASEALLKSAVMLEASADAARASLAVSLTSLADHAVPSGATLDRQMWLELVVRDASGKKVLESGTLDERGDLRDGVAEHTTQPGSDPMLVVFRQDVFFDPELAQPGSDAGSRLQRVEFLWEPNVQQSNLIPARQTVKVQYDLGSLPHGRYDLSLRLLFRAFAPYLLRRLEREAALDPAVAPRVPTFEMAAQSLSVDL